MRALRLIALTALIMSVPGIAMAEGSAGTVVRFDSNPKSMTLSSGEVITLPDRLAVGQVAAGDSVFVTWASEGPNRVATSVKKQFWPHEQ